MGEPVAIDPVAARLLLGVARAAIEARVLGRPEPPLPGHPPAIRRPRGAFVTLRSGGDLRGCIGVVEPRDPLVEAVAHCAVAAATEDPRFPPVTESELPDIHLEVSVLDRPFRVDGPGRIEPGRHGVIVSRGAYRGLLLPQVAIEHGWDAATLLEQCCRKAGLPADAWRRGGVVIEAFEAQVFSEPEAEG
ncbi:MAG: AmmeMemoRadiSam system protein A [Acidobacteriota bacterium]